MSIDTMFANVGMYVAVIFALAMGVERVMDIIKSMFTKHLVKKDPHVYITDFENLTQQDIDYKIELHEEKRQRLIRIWAIPVGIFLAVIANVDTFELFGIPSPHWFGIPLLGWLLSGLAASRGSAFWHDFVDLIGAVKQSKREVSTVRASG